MGELSGHWVINAPDVVTETFQGQSVVLDLSSGHYYSLGGNAGRIWSLLIDGYSIESIVDGVGAGRSDLVPGVRSFLSELVGRKLIRPGEGGRPEPVVFAEPLSGEPPALVVYDDLAELIYADPIHDVDEGQGWPVQRPATP